MPRDRAASVKTRWGVVAIAAAIVVIGSLDCVGLRRLGTTGNLPEADIDQASPYWETAPPPQSTARPASVDTCLALTASQSHREALDACAIAYEEDGGADIVEAIEGTRAILGAFEEEELAP